LVISSDIVNQSRYFKKRIFFVATNALPYHTPNKSVLNDALFIGIDFGTSGCRAIAIDAQGQIQAQARTALPTPTQQGHAISQDPTLWWSALEQVMRRLLPLLDRQKVCAIAVDGTSSTLLFCDENGKPCSSALMYNDARSHAELGRMRNIAPENSPVHSATSSLAKFLHLHARYPRARHVLHQADWISNRLLGRYGISDENNCLKLGYDPVKRCWPDWLDILSVPRSCLPKVYPLGTALGELDTPWCQLWGLSNEVLIVSGTTDSTASFIATGAHHTGDAVTALGSTLVTKVLSNTPVSSAKHGIYSHRLGEQWLVGGASNSGGAVLLKYFDQEQLRQLSQKINPDQPTNLNYYPLARNGERFPINDPDYAPRLTPRPDSDIEFLHGMLEGIANIEQQAYNSLSDLGAPPLTQVFSTGGGASNIVWTRIRQQALGVSVKVASHTEAAYGSALLALRGWKATD
jgi:sugar (pentulose or hexulose) kinase